MYDTSQQPEKMRERYKELPDEVQELFEYGTVEKVLKDTSKEFGLREEDVPLLQVEVDLILYGFLTRNDLPERLQDSLDIEELRAEQITQKLNTDLFVIVEPFLTYVEDSLDETEGDIQPSTFDIPNTNPNQEPKIENTKQKNDTSAFVKPLRTFAEDVEFSRIHGYGTFKSEESEEDGGDTPVHRSSQDDIINKP